jgi:hypothetical protein
MMDFLKFLQESQGLVDSSPVHNETIRKFVSLLSRLDPQLDDSLPELIERASIWLDPSCSDNRFFALQAVWHKELGELLLDTGIAIIDKNCGVYASRFGSNRTIQPIIKRRPKLIYNGNRYGGIYADGIDDV